MFENLSDRLEKSFKLLKGRGRITEINVAETLKDVRRALLDADVHFKIAKSFTDIVKEKALGEKILTAVKTNQTVDQQGTIVGLSSYNCIAQMNEKIFFAAHGRTKIEQNQFVGIAGLPAGPNQEIPKIGVSLQHTPVVEFVKEQL